MSRKIELSEKQHQFLVRFLMREFGKPTKTQPHSDTTPTKKEVGQMLELIKPNDGELSVHDMRVKINIVLKELKGRIDKDSDARRLYDFGADHSEVSASAMDLVQLYADLASVDDRLRRLV